jgi:hypothetical protein
MQKPDLASCLHVCCGDAAAGATKMVLRQETGDRGTPVIASGMLENAGPLTLLDKPQARHEWFGSIGFEIARYRGYDAPADLINEWQEFWTRIDDWVGPFVLWFSSANAADRSLLLAISNRIGERSDIYLIDVAQPADGVYGTCDVGALSPENLRQWISLVERLNSARRQSLSVEYLQLETAAVALRLFSEGKLYGAPVEALDERILSLLTSDWASLSRTCVQIAGAFGNGVYRDFDYSWLLWRMDVLQRAGRLERRGGAFNPAFMDDPLKGDVRLPG